MLMPRTQDQMEQAARDAEAWLDSLDPDVTRPNDSDDLRRIGRALGGVVDAQTELGEAVAAARAGGRSWARIGLILGVSGEAARQRYGDTAAVER
jgi:hypothetical protein